MESSDLHNYARLQAERNTDQTLESVRRQAHDLQANNNSFEHNYKTRII